MMTEKDCVYDSGFNPFLLREKPVMEHLRAVYSTLAIGVSIAAAGALTHMYTDMLRAGFMLSIG